LRLLGLASLLGTLLAAAVALGADQPRGQPQASGQPQELPAIRLSAGIHLIRAQVAMTPEQRAIGLMFRRAMAASEGMLFVFPEASQQCFWMKNTILPLSAAFVADDGSIINIEDMQPGTLDTHCSAQPVRYVLEMNQGWFAQRGIGPGVRLNGEPFSTRTKTPGQRD
jgi:uncharacterized membrane protein (UPF0127 family)